MGLDQWARATKGKVTVDDNGHKTYEEEITLAEWRKHPNLQGWMENLWRSKGGEGDFNCVPIELTTTELQTLRVYVEEQGLPPTQGFFFGDNSDEYYKQQDLHFIEQALEHVQRGYTIEYYSWW